MLPSELERLDQKPVSDNKAEIRLFGVVRNENLRLPAFLDHYRKLGVSRFFFVSNASTDGTNEFLLAQPDCHVFHTAGSYAKVKAGLGWLNPLITEFGTDHWIVLADADELLVYPDCETKNLSTFCGWMDEQGHQGLYVVLLDMYSDRRLQEIDYKRGDNMLNVCHYFDRDYHFVPRITLPFTKPLFPRMEPIGGPRLRFCFPRQNTPKVWPRLLVKYPYRLQRIAKDRGWIKEIFGENPAPQAFKIPLVKWQKGYAFVTSHRLNPIRLSTVTGALLHFKYLQDFSARVKEAVDRRSHFDGSSEYKKYAQLLEKDPNLTFMYEGSVVYQSTADLKRYNIVNVDPSWGSR